MKGDKGNIAWELAEGMGGRTSLSYAEAWKVVNALFGKGGIIERELAAGGMVRLRGFGTFRALRTKGRAYVLPDGLRGQGTAGAVVVRYGKEMKDRYGR